MGTKRKGREDLLLKVPASMASIGVDGAMMSRTTEGTSASASEEEVEDEERISMGARRNELWRAVSA
jgi:hypothetical protein